MKTSLESLANASPDDIFDTPEFRNIIEDHLTWLINHPNNTTKQVSAHDVDVYDFDWLGLLTSLQQPANLHYIIIRMNGGESLTDVPLSLRSLKIPDPKVIQNLIMLNNSTKKIK